MPCRSTSVTSRTAAGSWVPTTSITLNSYSAVARDLRSLGQYQESLDIARKVVNAFEAIGGRENLFWLEACDGFATALRKAGHHWDAMQESEHVLYRYRDYLGVDHMNTLRVRRQPDQRPARRR